MDEDHYHDKDDDDDDDKQVININLFFQGHSVHCSWQCLFHCCFYFNLNSDPGEQLLPSFAVRLDICGDFFFVLTGHPSSGVL